MAAIQDLLTCPICLEWLDVPKRLPCGHVYCLKHLQGLVQKESGKLKCPECCRDHDVPNEDVNEFPLDYRLEGFINPDARKQGKCKQCRGDKNTSKCDHCEKDLCEDCLEEHKNTLLGSIYYSLKKFAREFVGDEVKDTIEKKKIEIVEKRERNDKEQKKIKDEAEVVILAVTKRRDDLLLPFIQENELLDKQEKDLEQISKSGKFHEEMKDELEEMDCDVERMKKLQTKLEEMKTEFDEILANIKKTEERPKLVDFKHQTDQLQTMISEYGQIIIDYEKMGLFRTLNGEEDGEELKKPVGLCVRPQTDHVYLTTSAGRSIIEYNQDGQLIRKMKTNFCPRGITIDSTKRFIIPDMYGHKVWIYDRNFVLVKSYGEEGTGDGELKKPLDVVCDNDDNIYVSEFGTNRRVHVFSADGDFIRKFGSGILNKPSFMKITTNNRLLVADLSKNRVSVFTLNGQHETNIQVDVPIGICLDRNGYILVADRRNHTIRVFTSDYKPHATIVTQGDIFQNMCGIAITKSGSLFVTDRDHHKLHILR